MRRWNVCAAGLASITIFAVPALGQASPPGTSSEARKEFGLDRHPPQDLERRDGVLNDQEIVDYVQGIADRLARTTGEKAFEVKITRASGWYADLPPRDVLYLSGGLLERIENEAELAGLLAHQLAHMHPATVPAQGPSPAASFLSSCVLAARAAPMTRIEERRESEILATKAAIRTLRNAGYEPSAVLDLLSKLAYEKPAWAKAILPEDLLSLRAILEPDVLPQGGYIIDSSEFMRHHASIVAALGHAASDKAGLGPTPPQEGGRVSERKSQSLPDDLAQLASLIKWTKTTQNAVPDWPNAAQCGIWNRYRYRTVRFDYEVSFLLDWTTDNRDVSELLGQTLRHLVSHGWSGLYRGNDPWVTYLQGCYHNGDAFVQVFKTTGRCTMNSPCYLYTGFAVIMYLPVDRAPAPRRDPE
jgi:hypothetical protein